MRGARCSFGLTVVGSWCPGASPKLMEVAFALGCEERPAELAARSTMRIADNAATHCGRPNSGSRPTTIAEPARTARQVKRAPYITAVP